MRNKFIIIIIILIIIIIIFQIIQFLHVLTTVNMRNMLRNESDNADIASQVVGWLLGDFSRSAASIRADRGWVPPGFHLGSTSAARFSGSLERSGRRHDLGPIENKSEYLGASVGARNGSRTSAKHLYALGSTSGRVTAVFPRRRRRRRCCVRARSPEHALEVEPVRTVRVSRGKGSVGA